MTIREGECKYWICKAECCRKRRPNCPHLDSETWKCKLGDKRPEDCKIFPLTPWDVRNYSCSYRFSNYKMEKVEEE